MTGYGLVNFFARLTEYELIGLDMNEPANNKQGDRPGSNLQSSLNSPAFKVHKSHLQAKQYRWN